MCVSVQSVQYIPYTVKEKKKKKTDYVKHMLSIHYKLSKVLCNVACNEKQHNHAQS